MSLEETNPYRAGEARMKFNTNRKGTSVMAKKPTKKVTPASVRKDIKGAIDAAAEEILDVVGDVAESLDEKISTFTGAFVSLDGDVKKSVEAKTAALRKRLGI